MVEEAREPQLVQQAVVPRAAQHCQNRKRGEDGRFITKARLAEMAAEEAAAAAASGNSDEPQKASPTAATTEEAPATLVSETAIPQATPVP